MHVTAVGSLAISFYLLMHILGFMELNPRVGGLGHDVIYNRNKDFYYNVIYVNTSHR